MMKQRASLSDCTLISYADGYQNLFNTQDLNVEIISRQRRKESKENVKSASTTHYKLLFAPLFSLSHNRQAT